MEIGELLTRWSVRAALVFYVLALAVRMRDGVSGRAGGVARWSWTLGCATYLVHVICAFHFYHGWSHAAAYRETARQTAEVIGPDWGGGLYFNYAFTVVWTLDTLWWWIAAASFQRRPFAVRAAVDGFFAFMWINATVVFGQGLIRWAGLGAAVGLAMLWWRQRRW